MATLPKATTTLDDTAGPGGGGTDRLVVIGCVARNADTTPREWSSASDMLMKHDYSPAIDYCAMHLAETGKPVMFVAVPSATAGAVTQQNADGVTGSSAVAAVAGTNGVAEAVDGIFTVTTGGTIGAAGIVATLSLDGGRTTQTVRLGTANQYVIPYVGIKLTFGAGTLVKDDVFKFKSTAPRWDQAGIAAARAALAAQSKQARSWLVIGDLAVAQDATDVVTEANNYASANDRFTLARTQARDRYAAAEMTGSPTLTWAASGKTVTRSAGSWVTDGFKVGMAATITGASDPGNNVSGEAITAVTATVLTFGGATFTDEATVADCTATATELAADWRTSIDAAFDSIDGEKRIDIAAGRGTKRSPITGWLFRRPAAWALSIREYQHDVQIPAWRKADGPLSGWSIEDDAGNTIEHDERTAGGLLASRFSCLRTWANGPAGVFASLSLTRDTEGSLLSRTHNMHVANVACGTVQRETENAIGDVLELNDDGTATEASLVALETRVNSALKIDLLQNKGEGPRASSAKWTASRTDVLNVASPTLTGVLDLRLGAALEQISTRVRVQTAG